MRKGKKGLRIAALAKGEGGRLGIAFFCLFCANGIKSWIKSLKIRKIEREDMKRNGAEMVLVNDDADRTKAQGTKNKV